MKAKRDGSRLVIEIDDEERQELLQASVDRDDWTSDNFMADFLEPLTTSSELKWVCPEWTGDLTDAPMLGFFDISEDRLTVLERWAYMDYQIRSPLEDLLRHGRCVFTS